VSARQYYRVGPGDVPEPVIARLLALSVEKFRELAPKLKERGFPAPDPTTGNYDLQAVNAWRRSRAPHLFLTKEASPRDARSVCKSRLGDGQWLR